MSALSSRGGIVVAAAMNPAGPQGDRGCVGVYPVSTTLVLVLVSAPKVTTGRFAQAAKRAVGILLTPTS